MKVAVGWLNWSIHWILMYLQYWRDLQMKKNAGSTAKRPCVFVDLMDAHQRKCGSYGMHCQGTNGPLGREAAPGNPHKQSQPTWQDKWATQGFQHRKEHRNQWWRWWRHLLYDIVSMLVRPSLSCKVGICTCNDTHQWTPTWSVEVLQMWSELDAVSLVNIQTFPGITWQLQGYWRSWGFSSEKNCHPNISQPLTVDSLPPIWVVQGCSPQGFRGLPVYDHNGVWSVCCLQH